MIIALRPITIVLSVMLLMAVLQTPDADTDGDGSSGSCMALSACLLGASLLQCAELWWQASSFADFEGFNGAAECLRI